MSTDFDPEPEGEETEVVQRLEQSLNFWMMEKEDYPPAIRGVMAHRSDVRNDVAVAIDQLSQTDRHADLTLQKILWFDDKNEKLDEACEAAKEVFKPYATNADGLISFKDDSNTLLENPTRHRLIVSDKFAATNYQQSGGDDMILDDDDEVDASDIPANSWKRKISQTIKPWRVNRDGKIKAARNADDLSLTLNALLSRTKHGWLEANLVKLKRRRGSILEYARTVDHQRNGDQKFEFQVQLFGLGSALIQELESRFNNVACMYVETDERGNAFLTKVTTYGDQVGNDVKQIVVPIELAVVRKDGVASQLRLVPSGKYFEAKVKSVVDQNRRLASKFDLRKSSTPDKRYRFKLEIALDSPLLVASSGDGIIFQLQDMLTRFRKTTLASLRNEDQE